MALVLVVAQVVTAFGYPVATRAGRCGACGCDATGRSDGCACGAGQCAVPVPEPTPEPDPSCGKCGNPAGSCCCAPEPDPPACPKCRLKESTGGKPAPGIKWVIGMKARQCHGDGPLGLFADIPALPPAVPARPSFSPVPVGFIPTADLSSTSTSPVPLEPPPRCG
jgi:hypothetical protein